MSCHKRRMCDTIRNSQPVQPIQEYGIYKNFLAKGWKLCIDVLITSTYRMFPKLNHGRPDKNSGYVSKGNDKDFLLQIR